MLKEIVYRMQSKISTECFRFLVTNMVNGVDKRSSKHRAVSVANMEVF